MDKIITNTDYLLDLLVRMSYNSSAIEGNTLTLNQTADLIVNNYFKGANDLREIYEVINHKKCFNVFIDNLKEKNKISLSLIFSFHEMLMSDIAFDNGKFKVSENRIVGADFMTASVNDTPYLMKMWCENLSYQLENAITIDDKLKIILSKHIEFERIHPFQDGNGRCGRMLLNYSLISENLMPVVIPTEQRNKYISILREQDITEFISWSKEIQNNEYDIYTKFK